MKFFETLLNGIKAMIISHSYSKADSDKKFLAKEDETQADWNETNKSSAAYIQNKPTLIGAKGTAQGAEIFNEYAKNEASGKYSHAEGRQSYATGDYAHAEGHTAGATGTASHAEGDGTFASGEYSHAEGLITVASETGTHAEGAYAEATAPYAHAEGYSTIASGHFSHAEGRYTIAAGQSQHVQGQYNIQDDNDTYAHIVGNGTNSSNRSNAHTVDWDGNAWFAGDVYIGGTDQASGERLAKASELPSQVDIDGALNTAGKAADAKATGDAIRGLESLVGDEKVSTQIDTAISEIVHPVQSVNGQSGTVILTASDVGALPSTTAIPSVEGLATESYVDTLVADQISEAVANKTQVQIITWGADD